MADKQLALILSIRTKLAIFPRLKIFGKIMSLSMKMEKYINMKIILQNIEKLESKPFVSF
jgi:hypothetical protein